MLGASCRSPTCSFPPHTHAPGVGMVWGPPRVKGVLPGIETLSHLQSSWSYSGRTPPPAFPWRLEGGGGAAVREGSPWQRLEKLKTFSLYSIQSKDHFQGPHYAPRLSLT
jgi:hypothetical protein